MDKSQQRDTDFGRKPLSAECDHLSPFLAEAVEKLLKKPFSAEIGEHCQIVEFLSH